MIKRSKYQEKDAAPRALLVGEASTTGEPFIGRSGDRLRAVLKLDDLAAVVDVVNLFPSPMDRAGKGRAFPPKAARANADAILKAEPGRERFVLAGKRVAAAFRVRAAYFQVVERDGKSFMAVPHPSGINRWWNEAGAEELFSAAFYGFVEGGRP